MLPKLLLLVVTSTDVLKERLVFSKRYIREVLPPEAKELSKTKKSLMAPTTDQEPVPHPVSELEKFRQEKVNLLKF